MQKLHRFYIGLLILLLAFSSNVAAYQVPEVPTTIRFASLNIKLDGKARAIINTEISRLMANQKYWEEKLDRAQLYFPIIETVLIDEEVPIDFKYLVAQESSFKSDAVSTSNAVGFWQLKQGTAQDLGFRVDDIIDERKNITASTQAAARFLKKNNQKLNNWVSTLYSHYLGLGGASKVVPANWNNAREISLDSKTDIYLLRFFAHKIAIESALETYNSTTPIILLDSQVGQGKSFQDISRALNIDINELKKYNTWTSVDVFPNDRSYYVTLPVQKAFLTDVREKMYLVTSTGPVTASSTPSYGVSNSKGIYPILERKPKLTSDGHALYTINGLPGIQALTNDNAKSLASAGQIKANKLLKYNDMGVNDPIVVNEVYYLTSKKNAGPIKFHTARPGETLHQIAQMYGMRLRDLLKYNRINNRNYPLEVGRVLWLREKRPRRTKIEIKDINELPAPTPATPSVVEPIEPTTPEITKSEPATNANIPSNPSERKKYTPKLADKPTTEVSSPANTKPTKVESSDANIYKPSTKSSDVKAPELPKGSDRIVIISGSGNESEPVNNAGGFDTEDETPVRRPTPTTTKVEPSRPVSSATPSANTNAATEYRYHTVKAGQTLFAISRQYGVPVTDLLRWNRFSTDVKIVTGQRIIVGLENTETASVAKKVIEPKKEEVDEEEGWSTPVRSSSESTKSTVASSTASSSQQIHTVARGETYYSIARKYDLTLNELLDLNNLTASKALAVGQKLRVNASASTNGVSSANSATSATTHIVQKGETLFGISRQYNVSVEELKQLNNKKVNTVNVGETLKIPQR